MDTKTESTCVSRSLFYGIVLFLLMVYLVNLYALWGYPIDDAYISMRYADNFATGKGLVYNPGERVEGYTNFLWVMIQALIIVLGGDPVQGSLILGSLSGLIVWYVLLKWAREWFCKFSYLALLFKHMRVFYPVLGDGYGNQSVRIISFPGTLFSVYKQKSTISPVLGDLFFRCFLDAAGRIYIVHIGFCDSRNICIQNRLQKEGSVIQHIPVFYSVHFIHTMACDIFWFTIAQHLLCEDRHKFF